MKLGILFLGLALALLPSSAGAQSYKDKCGQPPRIENESLKGELTGKARLLSGFLGKAELGGAVEMTKRDVFQKYPNADKARTNAFLFYVACVLVMDDSKMTTIQKLRAIQEFKKEIMAEKPQQDLGQLRIELNSIRLVGERQAVVRLKFLNTNKAQKGIAIAFVHQGPIGAGSCIGILRDYCVAKAILTDNNANRFRFRSLTGLGMARDSNDWSILGFDESVVATLTFQKEGHRDWGSTFIASGEIYIAWRNESGEQLGPTIKGFSLEDVIR